MTEAARTALLDILNNYSSLDAFFASDKGAHDVIQTLIDHGIITQQEVAGLIEPTGVGTNFVLSPTGKDYITDLLIGTLFDEQTIKLLGNNKGLKQSILRALPSIIDNRQLKDSKSGDYSLTKEINGAIRLLYEARNAGLPYQHYILQVDAFEGKVSDRYSAFEMLLAQEMSAGVETFRQVLDRYNKSAETEANGAQNMFGNRTAEEIKNEILQYYGKQQQAEQQPANQQTQPTVSSTPAGNEPAETNKGEQVGQQPKGTNAPQEGGQNPPRGRKQVAKYIEKLKEVANRLSEQSTSGELNEKDVIEALTYIAQIESNLSHVSSKDDVIFADEEKLIERVKNLCNAYGYEVQPPLGLPYNDGMPVIADFVVDETQKKSSAINNSTDTADTLAGKRNDTATPQNTANSSAHKTTTSVPNNQTSEQKSVADNQNNAHETPTTHLRDTYGTPPSSQNSNTTTPNNTKETREQTNQRLAQERKERILSEGTSFDQDFDLVAPKDITEPQQISDNIVELVKGLAAAEKGLGEKGKSGSGYPTNPLHKYGGWVYGEGHIANAQHQVEEYLQALDVLDPKILNEWKKQNGIKTYKDLRDKVEKLYNQIKERWTEHDLTQPGLTREQKQSLIHDIADGNTKVALVTNKTLVKKMTELGATRKDIAEAISALAKGDRINGFYLKGTIILNTDALNTGMDIIQTFVHERQHLLTKENPQILDSIIANTTAEQLAQLLQTIAKTSFYNVYNNGTSQGHQILADEFLSHIMQEAYATDQDADAVAQQYGITNQDILTTLHNLDYEQRQSDNLSKARRNVLVSNRANNRGGKSSKDSQAKSNQVDEQRPRSNQPRNNTPTTGGQTSQNGVEQTLFSTDGSQSLAQLNDQFNKRLDELIADPTQKDRVLHLGRASQFLRDGGISDAEIVLEYDKLVAKAKDAYKNKHPFNLEDVKGLPKAISEPIAVFHNTNGTGNDVILTELQKDGNNFIVTIETQRKQRKGGVVLEVNEISTLFPKEARGIVNWVNLGEATNIDKEKALHFIEALRNHHGTSITSEELDLAAKIVQNFENPKLPEENDTRFSISGTQVVPLDDHTLVGLHNISADKLRKALKAGGLANPSAAVIDIAKQNHHGYGEISLVMPSALVDSKSGRNAGTYAGDAYTPTYPSVEYREGKETPKRIKNLLKDLPTFMQDKIARDIHYYMQGNIYNTGLPYLFLAQRGQQPSIVQNERQYPHITLRDIYDRLGIEYKKYVDADAIRGAHDKLSKDELYDFNLWLTHHGDPQEIEKWNDQLDKVRKANMDKGERAVELLKERAIDYKSYINDINAIAHDEVAAGNENYDKTVDAAKHIISEQGLTDEYNKWEQETLDNLGYEEVLFAGYTPMGNRRYLPNTIENASRLMNQKANTNSNDGAGVSETKALLMDKFKTLSDIRDHKDILEGDSEKVKQAYEQTSDDWFQLGIDFRDYTLNDKKAWGLSDNQFIASDEALARLQEAMLKRNPIAHLNAEYNYSLSADSEFGKRLMDMKERIKNLPSKYFETKFNRPVYLNEFRNAVIPNNLPQDLRDGLSQAGLGIYEYDPANETTSRREATLQATEDTGIRFSVSSYTPETDNTLTETARQEMQAIRDEAIANGTYMIEPNGNRTNLTERQWLQVRTKAFLDWFGDWLKAARIDKLRKSESVSITGQEITPSDNPKEYRRNALEYGKQLRGEYTNKDTGKKIIVNRDSIKEVLEHDYKDIEHLQSIAAIPQLIENSIYITSEEVENASKRLESAKQIHYYVCGLNINNVPYTAKIVIAELQNGDRYYDHKLTQIEKGDLINRAELSSTVADDKSPNSDRKDRRLFSILQTNCSKIIDENGAPLPVYHGTSYVGFSVFNTVGRFRGENSTSRNTGVYATDDRNLAYIYTSREDYDNKNDYTFFDWDGVGQVYSLFMNIKNPLIVECGGADFDEISIGGRKTSTDAVVRKLRKGGFDKEYDGAVFKNVYDGDYTTDYIALSPNQIKSATDNNGSFDNTNNDIRFSIFGGNSGYIGYSKSVRAVEAEEEGKRSISNFDKEFVNNVNEILQSVGAEPINITRAKQLAKDATPDEWHHTSMYGNKTNYYSPATIARSAMNESQKEAFDKAELARERAEIEEYQREMAEEKRQREERIKQERPRIQAEREARAQVLAQLEQRPEVVKWTSPATGITHYWINLDGVHVQVDNNLHEESRRYDDGVNKNEAKERSNQYPAELQAEVDAIADEKETEYRAQQLATETLLTSLSDAGIEVEQVSQEHAQQVLAEQNNAELMAVTEQFNDTLDKYTDENADNIKFDCGMPSEGLLLAGMPNMPIRLNGETLRLKLKKHQFTKDEIRNLPQYLQNPIAVFDGSHPDTFAVLVEMNINGSKSIISIDIKHAEIDDFTLVSSIYDKDKEGIINWINKGKMLSVDKEKALRYIDTDAPIAPTGNNKGAISAAKIVQDFDTAKSFVGKNTDTPQFSIRTTPAPKKTGIGYKVFVLKKDGKLYPPMVANEEGADTPVGVWLDADAAPIVGYSKTGRPQVKAGGKGTQGGSGVLAYRPGWHLGEIPYALQFNHKDAQGNRTLFPKDFVWAEVEYAADIDYQQEAEQEGYTKSGKYRHSYAGLKHLPTDGFYRYRTNPNPQTDPWIITGAMKVNRVLSNEEVDEMVRRAGREPQQRELLQLPNGTVYGYTENGKIYLTPEGLNPNTPIHEYSHLWVAAVKKRNPQLYKSLQDLFSRTNLPEMWDELDNDTHYSHLSDDAKLSEVISRYSGKQGAERMEQETKQHIEDARKQGKKELAEAISLRQRMRDLLKRFWNWVGENLFHLKNFGSREEAADRILYDLLNATDLKAGDTQDQADAETRFSVSPVPPKITGETTREWAIKRNTTRIPRDFSMSQQPSKWNDKKRFKTLSTVYGLVPLSLIELA